MILNVFDKNIIYRIEFPDPDSISHTYITQNNDLFIMTQKQGNHRLQYIDLDASMMMTQKHGKINKDFEAFRLQNLF